MKKQLLTLSLITFTVAATIVSCKKESSSNPDNDTAKTELTTHTDDQARFSSELDAVANDADVALESNPGVAGRFEGTQGIICDATVTVNLQSNPRTVTIVYDGTNCLGTRTRTGTVVISVPQGVSWKNAGAAVTVAFQNLKITRTSDNKSITINGTHTYTNVTGGLLINLPTLGVIKHSITSSGMTITFDNGTQRSWQVARQREFTYNNGVVISITGLHTEGSVSGIAEWGTNRFGGAFTTRVVEAIKLKQDCNFRITSGKLEHTNPMITGTATFGLDASGNPTGCPGANPYYYKLVWTLRNGGSGTVILPY